MVRPAPWQRLAVRWLRWPRRTLLQAIPFALVGALVGRRPPLATADPQPSGPVLVFDGLTNYVEAPDSTDFSVDTAGGLTVAAWLRPDTLVFPSTESNGYVHWLGKGEGAGDSGQQEWVFRMYSADNTAGRDNRISFYVFNPQGGFGIGSYFQDSIVAGQWLHVVGVVDSQTTAIYKNGVFRKCDQYTGTGTTCQQYADTLWITPQHGSAPLRMATRDFHSYFQGALAEVRVWSRPLGADEIAALYATDTVPPDGLVAEYLLHEGSGDVANDTADSHDGTIVGATWGSGNGLTNPGSGSPAAVSSASRTRQSGRGRATPNNHPGLGKAR